MEKPIFSEEEVHLIDYLKVIWKRKWLVMIPTLILVFTVGIISFILPKKWEIDAMLVPSKFLIETEGGHFEEIVVVDPKQIAGQINEGSYDHLIVTELNMDIKKFPKLKAKTIPETNLVRFFTEENEIEKAKSILIKLFEFLKLELDKKVSIEIKGIDSLIESKRIEKSKLEEEIKTDKKKLNIVTQRKKEIEEEMSEIKEGIDELRNEYHLSLKKENRSEAESLALLLYSNSIQESLRYYNTLNELLSEKKIEEENISLLIENNEKEIKLLDNDIDNLNERKGRIDYAQLIKEPTSSINPVSPKKIQNMLLAGFFGVFLFTILAFFLEYVQKTK